MRDQRTVQVTINLTRTDTGTFHWFVTTAEELQTVQWADDGSVENARDAIFRAIQVAASELHHFVRGGAVTI